MTELRQKMHEELILAGMAKKTQDSYLGCVSRLAKYYKRSPDELTMDEVKQFFLYLIKKKHITEKTMWVYISAIKFLYAKTLKQPWEELELIKPRKRNRLPVVLSADEVHEILENIVPVESQVALKLIYSCGLRVSEASSLRIENIDRRRMVLRITDGKGGKDREVPLAEKTLKLLEKQWLTHKSKPWLFPSRIRKGRCIAAQTIQRAFRLTVRQLKIRKNATVHSLRHSYATHLLDKGIHIHTLQKTLGHSSIKTTLIYLHLTLKTRSHFRDSINELMTDL